MKKSISLILCIIFVSSLFVTAASAQGGLGNFQKTLKYSDSTYSDVTSGDWFNESVKAAYEYQLMNGIGSNVFVPTSNVKICEVVALAARLNSIYNTGSASFSLATPWYQTYVDYAISHGIIAAGRFENYDVYATRYQVAEVFAAALPSSALPIINNITVGQIPDVSLDTPYQCVYTLYMAGVLTGKTAAGDFYPSENVLRSEIAAIVTRIADSSLRVKFTITPAADSGTGTVGKITSGTGLLTAVNNGRQYTVLAEDYFTTAFAYAALANAAGAQAALAKAKESILAAGTYAQNASAYCKENSEYSTAYNDINNSYLGCLEISKAIDAIYAAPLASPYTAASNLIAGVGEAMSRAATTISSINSK